MTGSRLTAAMFLVYFVVSFAASMGLLPRLTALWLAPILYATAAGFALSGRPLASAWMPPGARLNLLLAALFAALCIDAETARGARL